MPAGVRFFDFDGRPLLNNAGQMVFLAGLVGGGVNSSSIWSEVSGNLALVARTRSQAPGTPTGVTFLIIDSSSVVLNDAGQIAFVAFLSGTGVNSMNNSGIWATDRNGDLQLIARAGELLEISPGNLRTISSLSLVGHTGNGDGKPSGFNNRGQLAFHAKFTDDTAGIFVSNLVAIPEPSSLLLLALGVVGACSLQRRFRA